MALSIKPSDQVLMTFGVAPSDAGMPAFDGSPVWFASASVVFYKMMRPREFVSGDVRVYLLDRAKGS
jgi:hypothetical protein